MSWEAIHVAALPEDRLLADCEIRRGRRSGPGGQHRNKVETAVVVTHRPSGVRGEASERRSQEQNRRMALFRLRVNLALNQRHRPLPTEQPSPLWRSRCNAGRVSVNGTHEDFPALLAEALDVLQGQEMNIQAAAQWLGCTTSQLTKFLKLERRAVQLVNSDRRQRGLPPLR